MTKKYYYLTPQTEWSKLQPAPFICASADGDTEPYEYEEFHW